MSCFMIIGGAGYVGSHCVKTLARAGHECITFDNLSTGHREFVRWGPLIEGDVRDADALSAAFKRHKVDAVLHFAALAYVGDSMKEPGRYYDVNVNGTRTLLDAMLRAEVNKIIFSSSCATYGSHDAVITEDTPQNPINPYGYTKLVCERMMDDYDRAHGLRSVRLRYFNAAGADPEGELGEHHDPEPHLIPLVLDAAAGRRPDIKVFGTDYDTPDGTAVRDYIHVTDLGDAHLAAAKRLIDGGSTAAFNLATGAGVSVRQLIQAAEVVTGRPIRAVDAPRRPGDPASLVASAEAAKRILGWTAKRDLDAILADAWAWGEKRFPH